MVTARFGQMVVTLGPSCGRLAEQPLRLSHNTERQAHWQGPSSQSQGARAERRRAAVGAPPGSGRSAAVRLSKRRRAVVEAPPGGGRVSPMAVDRSRVAAEAQCEIQSNLLKL